MKLGNQSKCRQENQQHGREIQQRKENYEK
jgi:hypothetical protein